MKKFLGRITGLAIGALMGAALPVLAATFNLFSPATGILKGSASTYVTTAAASADVISLWSGSCDVSHFLRGDGTCASAGTVSISSGTGITATPNPIVGAGSLAVDQTFTPTWTGLHTFDGLIVADPVIGEETLTVFGADSNRTADIIGSPNAGVSLGLGVQAGTNSSDWAMFIQGVPASPTEFMRIYGDGGTTIGLPTGSDKGLGTLNVDTEIYIDNVAVCRSSGTNCPAGIALANPTGSIGLTAVNGVAATAERSDSTHALSQSIAPTWSGQHIFTGTTVGVGTTGVLPGTRSSNAAQWFVRSGAAANNRAWETITGGPAPETLTYRAVDDTGATTANYLVVTRGSGAAVGGLVFGNATDNTAYNFLGTGTLTANGNITETFNTNGSAVATVQNSNGGTSALAGFSLSNGTRSMAFQLYGTGSTAAGWTSGPVGEQILIGTSANLPFSFGTNGAERMRISGAGVVSVNGASNLTVNGTQVCLSDGTNCPISGSTGTFTGTLTGCTATPTVTVRYAIAGSVATVAVPGFATTACTSNATTMTITGAPAAIRPATAADMIAIAGAYNNTADVFSGVSVLVQTGGTFAYVLNGNGSGWSNVGNKAPNIANVGVRGTVFSYPLN